MEIVVSFLKEIRSWINSDKPHAILAVLGICLIIGGIWGLFKVLDFQETYFKKILQQEIAFENLEDETQLNNLNIVTDSIKYSGTGAVTDDPNEIANQALSELKKMAKESANNISQKEKDVLFEDLVGNLRALEKTKADSEKIKMMWVEIQSEQNKNNFITKLSISFLFIGYLLAFFGFREWLIRGKNRANTSSKSL